MLFGKYINKYYLRYAFFFIVGILALIAVDFFQLFVPQFLGDIVDILSHETLSGDDKQTIIYIVVNTIVIAAILMVGRMVWRFTIFHASFKIEAGLRKQMFLKAERLSQRYFHETKVGTIMAWFTNDIETVEEFFGWGTIMIIDAIFLSGIVLVKMFMMEPILSLISLVPIFLIIVWGALVEKYMSMKWDTRQKAFDELYDFSQENFTGISVIKAFVKETKEFFKFAELAKKNKDVNVSFARVSVLFESTIGVIITSIFAIIMGFGGWFVYAYVTGNPVVVFSHQINLKAGQLVAFTGYFDTLIWPMMAMGQIVSMRSRAKASLKRITHFLDEEEEIKDLGGSKELNDVKGAIAFNNFSFTYPGSKTPSLENISLEIKEGETVGIVGKIGSGKTTLVNSLLRLYNLEPGSILIDGEDIMSASIKSVRDNIAYVPQDNFLFSDKISNNIGFYKEDISLEEIRKAASFADVDKDVMDFKEQYETVSGERGVTLSGGQKQRISIARAYIKDAPIMILDDSVSAVDVKTEEEILAHIKEERKGKTTIMVASRVSTVSHLDKIIVLSEGKLEAFGTPEELLKTSPTYKKMVYLQKLESEMKGAA